MFLVFHSVQRQYLIHESRVPPTPTATADATKSPAQISQPMDFLSTITETTKQTQKQTKYVHIKRIIIMIKQISADGLDEKFRNFPLTSTRFFNEIMSRGKWRRRFLWINSDFKLVRCAMLAGSSSIKLSHRVNACNCGSRPTASGTSVSKFPPNDSTLNLFGRGKIADK